MRKIALLLAFLLAVGSASVLAQMAISTDFSISGNGSVKFAYDIDTGGYGFTNASASDISIALVASGDSDNDAGMGAGWRGVVKLTGFAIAIDSGAGANLTAVTGLDDTEFLLLDDATSATEDATDTNADEATLLETGVADSDILVTNPGVEAYITNDTITVWVFDKPGNTPGKVAAVEDDADAAAHRSAEGNDAHIATNLTENGGVKIQYHTDAVDVAVGLTSLQDETGDPATQGWQVSAYVDAAFDPVTVAFAVAQDVPAGGSGVTGLGASVGASFGPADVTAGVDLELDGSGGSSFEVGGGVDVAVVDGVDVGADFIYSDNVAVALDTEITVSLGLVDGLTLDLLAGLYDLTGGDTAAAADPLLDEEPDTRIAVDASYTTDVMAGTLTAAVGFDTNNVNDGTPVNGADFTLTLADQIPNTSFAVAWASTDLENDVGVLSFTTKVSY